MDDCCNEQTPECLSCKEAKTEVEWCQEDANKTKVGCKKHNCACDD